MKIARLLLIAAVGGCLLCAACPALAAKASELYQEGLMKETAEGDLQAAIEIYQKIVTEHADTAGVAARAQLHIGICYEKLGREQAREAYQKVIDSFPAETDVVQQARERLQALAQTAQVKRPEIGAGPQQTNAVIQELDRLRKPIRSLRGTLTTTMEMMGNSMTVGGKILFKRPDLIRMENTGSLPTGTSITISDSKTTWVHQPQINMVVKIDIERIRGEFPDYEANNNLFNPFQGLDAESIQFIRHTAFGGGEVAVFQGKTKGKMAQMGLGQLEPEWVEVWIGMDDGLLRKMVMYRKDGTQVMAVDATVDEIDPVIPDSAFVFIPPEGAQVMDATEPTLNMMRQAAAQENEPPASKDASGADAETIMREIGEKRKAVESYSARLTRQMQMMGATMTTQTTEWYRGKKSRQETTTSMPTGKTIIVNDEQTMWTYMPAMNMVQKMDLQRMKEARESEDQKGEEEKGDEKPGSFHGMGREGVRYLGRETLEEVDVHVFEGDATKAPQGFERFQFERIKIWIGAADGLVRKMLAYNGEGKEVIAETRTDVEIDPTLPDSLFVFTPPEGVQVMDMTQNTIDMVQKMKAGMEAAEGEADQ